MLKKSMTSSYLDKNDRQGKEHYDGEILMRIEFIYDMVNLDNNYMIYQ